MKNNLIDLFCGAGGFSLGFEHEGFESILAIDKWNIKKENKSEKKQIIN